MKVMVKKDGIIWLNVEDDVISYQVLFDFWIQYDLGLGKVEVIGGLMFDFCIGWVINLQWKLQIIILLEGY